MTSLFKSILNSLFPPFCIGCQSLLMHNVRLCEVCQHLVSCCFQNAREPYLEQGDWICPLFEKSKDLERILSLIDKPIYQYLTLSLASLTLIKLFHYQLPLPKKVRTSLCFPSFLSKKRAMKLSLNQVILKDRSSGYDLVFVSSLEEVDRQRERRAKTTQKRPFSRVIWVIEQFEGNF